MKRCDGGYMLDSGKELTANNGILGINEQLEVFEGYDGELTDNCIAPYLTLLERGEIAEYMISLWSEWAKAR